MKTKLYIGFILIQIVLINEVAIAQISDTACWVWAKSVSSTTGGVYSNAIAVYPEGNGDVYVSGGFNGIVDFDPGPGTFSLSSGSDQDFAVFISKYDGLGNFIWARAFTGIVGGVAFAISIAIDPVDGAVYTTGHFNGTVDFDPGPNSFYLTSGHENEVFISKINNEGNFVWVTRMGGPEDDFGSLVIDPEGSRDVYITGQFKGTVDFDASMDIFNLTANGNHDIFIAKINNSGNFLWAKAIGGPGEEVSRTIVIDPTEGGKIYITGYFEETVDFDPGANKFELSAIMDKENFVAKWDSSGNLLWAAQLGTVGSKSDGSIALDAAGNGVYTTGSFQDSCDFNPGENIFKLHSKGKSDIFISKLTDSGEFLWAKAMGGADEDFGTAVSIQPEEDGNVYTIGRFKGTADFDPGPDEKLINSFGDDDVFISCLQYTGDFRWSKTIRGSSTDFSLSTAIDNNFLYLTGSYLSQFLSFDSLRITNGNASGADLFIAKLDTRIVSVDQLKSESLPINLFPNPATNQLTIGFNRTEFFNVGINLYNVYGDVVYSRTDELAGQNITIDISALSPGIYFVELNVDGHRMIEKVVKE